MYLFKCVGGNVYEKAVSIQKGLAVRIWEYIENQAKDKGQLDRQRFSWRMSGSELLRRCLRYSVGEQETERYKVIADVQDFLGNTDRTFAQFFEVREIMGFSGWNWTPMLWKLRLQLEVEFEGGEACQRARETNRWEFDPAPDFVYEFLRLQADHRWRTTRKGARGFGMVGGLNGVLLRTDALKYFLESIDTSESNGGAG